MPRMTSKYAQPADSDNESLVRSGSESLAQVLDSLGRYVARQSKVLDDTEVERAESTANHLAQIGTRIAQIVGELRKVEHHEQRAAGEITPKSLAEHLRKMDPPALQAHLRDVEALARPKRSVLGG